MLAPAPHFGFSKQTAVPNAILQNRMIDFLPDIHAQALVHRYQFPHCCLLLMATSSTPRSATPSSASGTCPVFGDLPPDRPVHDHSTASNRALSHQPGSPSLSPPDDVHDPFAASLHAWQAIPQDARRAFCYFLNYPTPPASPPRSSRSPRRHVPQTLQTIHLLDVLRDAPKNRCQRSNF